MIKLVQVELPGGEVIWAKVASDGPADVSSLVGIHRLDMDQLRATVGGVSHAVRSALGRLEPDEINIEFGLELALKSGKLTSVLAEASGKASVKVSVGWRPIGNERVAVTAAAHDGDEEDSSKDAVGADGSGPA
jgi:Trypsin-co-occurring domain 1